MSLADDNGRPASPRSHLRRSQVRARRLIVLLGVAGIGGLIAVVLSGSGGSPGRGSGHRLAADSPPPTRVSLAGQPVDPSVFDPGACIAYPPTAGNRHETIFLDAGHGGIDPGAVGTTESGRTVHEAQETLPVELDAMAMLRAQGYRVVVSRTTDSSVTRLTGSDTSGGVLTAQGSHNDVAARDQCANRAHADLLVGIYFDAGASESNAGSITAYDPLRPFASANLRLAKLVQGDVLASLNSHGWRIPNGGVISDAYLGGPPLDDAAAAYGHLLLLGPAMAGYFSTPSDMPGTLIEPLFITDPFEASIAASTAGQHAIAAGIDEAVRQYFGPPSTTSAG